MNSEEKQCPFFFFLGQLELVPYHLLIVCNYTYSIVDYIVTGNLIGSKIVLIKLNFKHGKYIMKWELLNILLHFNWFNSSA